MLIAMLQAMLKLVLILGMMFGLAFMVICTAFVVVCIVGGDIKISITRHNTVKE